MSISLVSKTNITVTIRFRFLFSFVAPLLQFILISTFLSHIPTKPIPSVFLWKLYYEISFLIALLDIISLKLQKSFKLLSNILNSMIFPTSYSIDNFLSVALTSVMPYHIWSEKKFEYQIHNEVYCFPNIRSFCKYEPNA